MGVDDEVEPRLPRDPDLLRRRGLGGFGLGDVEELHAGDLVHGQHGGREPGGGPEEIATRHPGLGGIDVHVLADLLAHVTREEERCPLRFGGHGAMSGALVSLEVLENIELHASPPDQTDRQVPQAPHPTPVSTRIVPTLGDRDRPHD